MYKKAIGFYAREQKAFKVKTVEYDEATGRKIKEFEELKTAEEVHYFEPDIKAIIFWLKNRKPDIWKEKVAEAMADDEGTGAYFFFHSASVDLLIPICFAISSSVIPALAQADRTA